MCLVDTHMRAGTADSGCELVQKASISITVRNGYPQDRWVIIRNWLLGDAQHHGTPCHLSVFQPSDL